MKKVFLTSRGINCANCIFNHSKESDCPVMEDDELELIGLKVSDSIKTLIPHAIKDMETNGMCDQQGSYGIYYVNEITNMGIKS